MGFTKLDEGLVQSSIMNEDGNTFKVWITLLAICKEDGIAHCSSVFLSAICHLPQDMVDEIIKKLSAPDSESRSTKREGRRIRRVDGGYELINYFKYRESGLRKAEAERKRLYRKQLKDTKCPDTSGRCPDPSASASASEYASASSSFKDKEKTDIHAEVIAYLNEKAGKNFDPKSKDTIGHINALIEKGRTIEDFRHVIDVKVAKWKGKSWEGKNRGDTVIGDDLLRPSTLFRPTNFENYLNESMPGEKHDAPSKFDGLGREV